MDGQDSNSVFIFTLSSLTIILLTFFVYLNSRATPNSVKEKQVLKSVETRFIASEPLALLKKLVVLFGASAPQDVLNKSEEDEKQLLSSDAFEALDQIGAEINAEQVSVFITLPAESLFPVASAQLKATAIQSLMMSASEIRHKNLCLQADLYNPPVKTSDSKESPLSVARAGALSRFFKDQGIKPDAVRIGGSLLSKENGEIFLSITPC